MVNWIHIHILLFNLIEFLKSTFRYYRHFSFLLIDLLLHGKYFFKSPYKLCQKQGDLYGETPLTTIDMIARECRILSHDVVFDLGCGVGRCAFWLSHFIRCETYGIDHQNLFIKNAEKIKQLAGAKKLFFIHRKIQDVDFSRATVIYLYGTAMGDELIAILIQKFRTLPPGTKIISVSFPLQEFCNEEIFELKKQFKAQFPWGKADVFFQTVI